MYFSRYCVRHLMEKLEMKVIKAITAYLKLKQFVAKLFLLNAITCKQAVHEIYGTYNLCIIALPQYNTVRIYKMYKNNLTV